MIRINLLPVRETAAEFGRRQELTVAIGILGLTVIVLAGLYWIQFRNVSASEAELANLRQELGALDAKAKGVGEMEKKVADLKDKLKVIDTLNKKKTGPVRVMESLSAAMPARLWLTQFREASGNATIDGLAVDNQTIAEFMKALANSVYFNNVELVETAQTELEGVPLKRFSLNSRIIYQPPEPDGKKEAAKN
ncbi:MAG: PilN domain-containing protein [Deltaproteobacteria bacterium]|nr:PilN domain-containing protein [Deltaproteobacteria bacterium]